MLKYFIKKKIKLSSFEEKIVLDILKSLNANNIIGCEIFLKITLCVNKLFYICIEMELFSRLLC